MSMNQAPHGCQHLCLFAFELHVRTRGGLRQRLRAAAAESESEDVHVETPLNDNLRRRWGKGELTSAAVQDLAKDAAKQGAHSLEQIEAELTA